ncbi:hypothetical protein [Actinoplanes sp. NPDC049265]|uniref:hypothetical protein n=1 Tax=Actinoplanes sp. NPDC049265 TaxID=3363902 RepID=UPI00372462F3
MALRIARRVFAGLTAAALAATTGALPASAADAAQVYVVASDVLLPVDGAAILVSPHLAASEPVTIEDAQVTFRLTGMYTAVTLTGADQGPVHCSSTTPTEVVCVHDGSLTLTPDGIAGLFRAYAKADYNPRSDGSLAITFSGRGYGPVTSTVAVRAADAVDLTAGPPVQRTQSPGDRFGIPLRVKNTGTDGINGIAVILNSGPDITTRDRPSNCWFKEGRPTACFWDKRIVWDSTYQAGMGLYISKDAQAPARTSLQPQWMTGDEFADYQNYLARLGLDLGLPGTDYSMKLQRLTPPTGQTKLQADQNPADNWSYVDITIEPSA